MQMPDGSLLDESGKVLHFPTDRFLQEIVLPDSCFLCAAPRRSEAEFSDEHVIPNWILKLAGLHQKQMTMINGKRHRYGSYVVPCCVPCNQALAKLLENPVSDAFKQGRDGIVNYISGHGPQGLLCWLALLFVKVHLKERTNRIHADRRLGETTVADELNWVGLHHVYCIARAGFANTVIDPDAMGSLFIGPARVDEGRGLFDYVDITEAQAMYFRLGPVFIIHVLNDASAAQSVILQKWFAGKKFGSFSVLQSRELLAHFAYINMQLKKRPKFGTVLDLDRWHAKIFVQRSAQIELKRDNKKLLGALLVRCWRDLADEPPSPTFADLFKRAKSGNVSTLFRDDGSFNSDIYVQPVDKQ
jgi:hypothetical protein